MDRIIATACLGALLCGGCLSDEGDGGGGGGGSATEPVTGCDWPDSDTEWDWPVGWGHAKNSTHTTLRDTPLTLEPAVLEVPCFDPSVTEVVDAPESGAASVNDDGTVLYEPSLEWVGFGTFTVRVAFTRSDEPSCAGAEPPEPFLHESTADGGSDLARIGVHVIAPVPLSAEPCEEDCVSIEVVDVGGFRFPTFALSEPGPSDHPLLGCSESHWIAEPVFHTIQVGDLGSYQLYPLDNPAIEYRPPDTFKDDYGACGVGASSEVTRETTVVTREHFEAYCAGAWHNHVAHERELLLARDFVVTGRSTSSWRPDFPAWSDSVEKSKSYKGEYESLEALERKLMEAEPLDVLAYANQILSYVHGEDDKYVRALRWGESWGAFETEALSAIEIVRSDQWVSLDLDEQAAIVDGLLTKLNDALGGAFAPLDELVATTGAISSRIDRIKNGIDLVIRVYEVFDVNPDDPLQVAEALASYLELLAVYSKRVLPPVGILMEAYAEGVSNMLPHLRAMAERTRATNSAIDSWLADAEDFAEGWEDLGSRGAPLEEEPALDVTVSEEDYYPGWKADLINLRRNTWSVAARYGWVMDLYLPAFAHYISPHWESMATRLRNWVADAETEDERIYRQEQLDEHMDDWARAARHFVLLFRNVTAKRQLFYEARSKALAQLESFRESRPGFADFKAAYEHTLKTQIGDDPWRYQRADGRAP